MHQCVAGGGRSGGAGMQRHLCTTQHTLCTTLHTLCTSTANTVPPLPPTTLLAPHPPLQGLKPVKQKDPQSGKFYNDYWETSKKMLSDMGFLDGLRNYDKVSSTRC